jgi:hypothetical protein
MSADLMPSKTETVGQTAGIVWQHLASAGPASLTGLAKEIAVPRDLVMQAIGWLAREDKVVITQNGRNRTISLKN